MKSPMQTARRMPRQPGKRRQGRVGKGDVQFGQTKRKGALICLIGPLAKKTNFHNHGTGLAYHHNYEPVRAKSLKPDNAGSFGSCA
jgi:hypothetical protein